jgi:hypothetical protein
MPLHCRKGASTLPGAAAARRPPVTIAFTRRRSALRLIIVNAHQAEAVRRVRTPIMVRPEPDISIIVRSLFVVAFQDAKLRLVDIAHHANVVLHQGFDTRAGGRGRPTSVPRNVSLVRLSYHIYIGALPDCAAQSVARVTKCRVAILTSTARDLCFTGRAPQAHRPN